MRLSAALIPLALASLCTSAVAAKLSVEVRDAQGNPLADAVVSASAADGRQFVLHGGRAIMDQKDKTFVPHVLPVEVGTSVKFPNSDNIQHSVYSFSRARTFQLPLYKGTPSEPVTFPDAGVVTLGCNIHDKMNGYIVVLDTPYFDKTEAGGAAEIGDIPPGKYAVSVWQPDMKEAPPPQTVVVGDADPALLKFTITLAPPVPVPATTNKLEEKFRKFGNGRP